MFHRYLEDVGALLCHVRERYTSAFEHGLGLASSASRSFATPHVTAPPSPVLYRSARACTLSVSLWRLRARSCEHARACVQMLGKCVQESERKGLRRKGERTSCRVAARGAARALRSACGAGTHTDSQRGLRYKTCAQLPEPSSEPMDTHIKRLSLHICMLRAIFNCILFHCLLHYIYTYRYHVDR